MKKLLATLLAISMLASLAACGSSGTESNAGETSTAAETEGTAETPDAEESEESSDTGDSEEVEETAEAVEAGSYDIDADLEPITIRVATSRSETDFVYEQLKYLCDYVEENSNGTISFEYYIGGTFCTMAEEFSYVSSGAVDMVALFEGTATNFIPLWQFSRTASNFEEAMEISYQIITENEETSAALYAEADENNIHPLGVLLTGNTAFSSTTSAETIADLCNGVYGTARSAAYFEALGLNVVTIENSDIYESLSRGLIDSTSSTITGIISGKYYEVAPYVLLTETCGGSGMPTLNLDVWNSLTSEQQRLFEDAYKLTAEWAVETYAELFQGYQDEIVAGGGTVYLMNDEDNLALMTAEAQDIWDTSSAIAEANGKLEEFRTIEEYATELCGVTIDMG